MSCYPKSFKPSTTIGLRIAGYEAKRRVPLNITLVSNAWRPVATQVSMVVFSALLGDQVIAADGTAIGPLDPSIRKMAGDHSFYRVFGGHVSAQSHTRVMGA